jgi:hypothetical protein
LQFYRAKWAFRAGKRSLLFNGPIPTLPQVPAHVRADGGR